MNKPAKHDHDVEQQVEAVIDVLGPAIPADVLPDVELEALAKEIVTAIRAAGGPS